jgi:FkbM family methyltransferase
MIRENILRDNIVLDIGANIGYYTKAFSSLVGENGLVLSFEPIPDSVKVLRTFVKKANLTNVHVYDVALSDTAGTAVMKVPGYKEVPGYENSGKVFIGAGKNYYAASITHDRTANNKDTFEVKTDTIDNVVRTIGKKIDFIKCDVEGHELACITGGMSTIQRDHPILYIEIMDDLNDESTNGRKLYDQLLRLGYQCYVQNGDNIERFDLKTKSINYLFKYNGN